MAPPKQAKAADVQSSSNQCKAKADALPRAAADAGTAVAGAPHTAPKIRVYTYIGGASKTAHVGNLDAATAAQWNKVRYAHPPHRMRARRAL